MINTVISNKNRKRAFTLVEVMVAVLLLTVVLTAIYQVWSKVQQGIARSHTRQALQTELRNAANFMSNDFKSIKFSEDTFKLTESEDGKSFSMSFERFVENKDEEKDKLVMDIVDTVKYDLKNNILTRIGDKKTKILSSHCDGVSISRAAADASDSGALENSDEDFKAGREAQLDITITGKKIVPGNGEEMYHVEKTSVVMRNEYSKKVNKTFISTFDLTKKETDEVIQEGNNQMLEVGGLLDPEFLKTLDDDVLSGMDEEQKALLQQAEDSLDDLNDSIDDTDTGESGWSKFWGSVAFWSESEGEKVRGLRSDLSDAKTEDEVKSVKEKLEQYTKDKEVDFLSASTGGRYNRMEPEEKELYKRAYDMKVQDRNLEGGYNKLVEEKGEEEAGEKPSLMIDTLTGQNTSSVTIQNSDGTTSTIAGNTVSEENQKLIDAYNSIDLSWMGEYGEEEDDVGIYNAARQLISEADSKIDLIRLRDNCNTNIANIEDAMANN